MAAHGHHKSQALNRQPAEHKGRPLRRGGEEHQRGDGKKESGWHHQQSGVFHLLSFF
jgi:hypothetical protein